MREGRSVRWKRMKKLTNKLIERRRNIYMDSQRMVLLEDDGHRSFFKNVRSYKNFEKPRVFDVRELLGLPAKESAETLSDHFTEVSNEFAPLEPADIPVTHDRDVEVLLPFQVAGRLRAFRKPKSMVVGDIFPKLVTRCADFLALPLTDIYNEVCLLYTSPSPRD